MLFGFLYSLYFLGAAVLAAPSRAPEIRLIVNPPVTNPTAFTVWVVGNRYNVTWDITQLPPLANITNDVGRIVLGQFNGDGEKLYTDDPLANGFFITDASQEITCPDVDDGNYIIVCEGQLSAYFGRFYTEKASSIRHR
ncbi:hypothetical protein PHLGIDRAFT_98827 [Phlebiopsis gigantea 11061_1 CR5-6]|uniref:Uncharacterized protein n=1 Tax=Phlebiopsis gigantea (strain 11061_1 CR5-6) TaxID=745531 RepID=A0A0C3P2C6_PHLG1|nr:hypothetical protein PHLGIDRAFT_98827 [Phlebiopsis gigantea 11061_1 CR5-6]